jgi:hypothetical protein
LQLLLPFGFDQTIFSVGWDDLVKKIPFFHEGVNT